jgi:hypothetical protein
MNKRNFIKAAGVAAVAAPLALSETFAAQKAKRVKIPKYKNEDFYQEGKFLPEKGKQAYYELMAAHGYPITENLRANIWATDFGLGDFMGAGMGGVFWINLQEYGYFAHEIYLFPGQMIVEHAHLPTAKGKAKMETWHVRHGSICTIGEEGEPLPAGFKLPKSQESYITVKKHYVMKPGEIRTLNRLEAKHFMMGGPEGAIVSEYASFHDGDGLRFTNPGVKF